MNGIRIWLKSWSKRYWNSFSFVGLVFATLFFAASVTPSLLPRPYVVQGILSGFSLAIGYGVGVFLVWLWQFLELRQPTDKLNTWSKRVTTVIVAIVFFLFVRQSAAWQNSIRELMEMPPVETADPYRFFVIALIVAVFLVAITRSLILAGQVLSRRLGRYIPRRISIALSTLVVLTIAILISNGLIAKGLLRSADKFFLKLDEVTDDGIEQPSKSLICGNPDSLVSWDIIGRRGKEFIVAGPTQESIFEFTGKDAKRPIRVYVGMSTDLEDSDKAKMALAELKRVGGFDRKVLIIATPTGTGWLDEGAVDPIEYLHNGDTAIVATQYSYLPSWMTILVEPMRARHSATLLFNEIYDYWTTLPKQERPELYLFGLSLGSFGSEGSAELISTFEDPIQGAVRSGPPFPSGGWASIVAAREEGSPIWMPKYRDSSMIRFTAQTNHLQTNERWGPIRDVYIQYASDPMVWFSPRLAWRCPQWLNEPRGPDVSPALRWYPIVTFLQVGFDLPMATSVPIGYGHNYSPSSYIDAWVAVTQPEGWTEKELIRLKKYFMPSTES